MSKNTLWFTTLRTPSPFWCSTITMYSTNTHLPKIRRDVAIFAKKYGIRKAHRHYGYALSAIHKWVKVLDKMGHHPIPTKSSRPHSHPQTTDESIVK